MIFYEKNTVSYLPKGKQDITFAGKKSLISESEVPYFRIKSPYFDSQKSLTYWRIPYTLLMKNRKVFGAKTRGYPILEQNKTDFEKSKPGFTSLHAVGNQQDAVNPVNPSPRKSSSGSDKAQRGRTWPGKCIGFTGFTVKFSTSINYTGVNTLLHQQILISITS